MFNPQLRLCATCGAYVNVPCKDLEFIGCSKYDQLQELIKDLPEDDEVEENPFFNTNIDNDDYREQSNNDTGNS